MVTHAGGSSMATRNRRDQPTDENATCSRLKDDQAVGSKHCQRQIHHDLEAAGRSQPTQAWHAAHYAERVQWGILPERQ